MLRDPTGDPCPKSWAVAHHLSPISCQWGFLPFLLPIPFQKQPDQKLMKQRQTDRETYRSSLMPHIIVQHVRAEDDLGPPSPLVWELLHDPRLPSSLHQSWVLIKPVDTFKSAKKVFRGDRS